MINWKDDFSNFNLCQDLIIPAGKLSSADALQVYNNDYQARLLDALCVNYEATWVTIGDEDFIAIAKEYIQFYPSNSYSLNFYGTHFPEFLHQHPKIIDSYVFQMALFERHYWKLFHSSFKQEQTINELQIEKLRFNLEEILLINSQIDLLKIWQNRDNGLTDNEVDAIFKECNFALFKSMHKVEISPISKNQFLILEEFKRGKCLQEISVYELETSEWAIIFRVLSYCPRYIPKTIHF